MLESIDFTRIFDFNDFQLNPNNNNSIELIHFSGVTNRIHYCLRFPSGSRNLIPALVSQSHVLELVSHNGSLSVGEMYLKPDKLPKALLMLIFDGFLIIT